MAIEFDSAQFLMTPEPPDLGPGPRPGVQTEQHLNEGIRKTLQRTSLPMDNQELIRALLLLWHDHLDAAHGIAQDIANADGAFVHGVMHRREPDYGNAAYWFRRVGRHPVFPEIARQVPPLLDAVSTPSLSAVLVPRGEWDPIAFIHGCERAAGGSQKEKRLLREIQRVEITALLNSLAAV